MNNWQKAKDSIPRCSNCEDWERMGLSSRCPACDARILAKYNKLNTKKGPKNAKR